MDEVLVRLQGMQHWRTVDQDGVVLDILVQSRRDAIAAKRFFRRLLSSAFRIFGDGAPLLDRREDVL
jgi:transposase-like protein